VRRYIAAGILVLPLAVLARLEAGLYRDAETMYRATLARHPDSWLALTNLAVIELPRSPAAAASRLRESLRHNPDFADTHYNLGRALQEMGHTDEALAAYRRAIQLNPRNARAFDNLAALQAAGGRLDEAERNLREAIRLQPSLAGAHTNLGIVLSLRGRIEEAIASHREAIRLAPEFGPAYINLGNVLFDSARFSDAVAAYREAARLLPERADLRDIVRRAEAAAQRGRRLP
jgi:tetratricopeptide (TPR) repeat protein